MERLIKIPWLTNKQSGHHVRLRSVQQSREVTWRSKAYSCHVGSARFVSVFGWRNTCRTPRAEVERLSTVLGYAVRSWWEHLSVATLLWISCPFADAENSTRIIEKQTHYSELSNVSWAQNDVDILYQHNFKVIPSQQTLRVCSGESGIGRNLPSWNCLCVGFSMFQNLVIRTSVTSYL